MPKPDTSGNQGNNSTRTASVSKRNKRFPYLLRDMWNLPVEPEETLYQVSFSANVRRDPKALGPSRLEYMHPFQAVHPLLALGLAIADVENRYYSVFVDACSIEIRKL